jgi:hypothetical protein
VEEIPLTMPLLESHMVTKREAWDVVQQRILFDFVRFFPSYLALESQFYGLAAIHFLQSSCYTITIH